MGSLGEVVEHGVSKDMLPFDGHPDPVVDELNRLENLLRGPKQYLQGKTLPTQNIDMHKYDLLQVVNFIAEHYTWGSKQYVSLWRSLDDGFVEIKSDEHLREWFQLNIDKGVVCIDAKINDFNGPLQFSPTKCRFHPSVRSRACISEIATNEGAKKKSARNERATNEGAKKKRAKNSIKKGSNDEDAVGIDDEGIYSDNESLVAHSDSSYDSDLAESSDSDCSDPEFDPDQEIVDKDDDVPVFAYDVQDPCIDVGVVFPDVDQCKLAVTHHAILNDHAFETVKNDKKRFRAICKRAEEGCKWCFFASTSPKYIGCKNMKKKFHGPLFAQNMWAAAKSFTNEKFTYHMGKIEEKCPEALSWLDDNHPYIWSRSKFSEECKVDYINNNLSECFNSWVSKTKDRRIVDMHDVIRQMIITKFVARNNFAGKMEGRIIPAITKSLNAQSKNIKDHEDRWTHVDLGYKIKKPRLRRKPRRPRVARMKASDEAGTSKRKKCTECNELGHTAKTCQGGPTASQKRIHSSSEIGTGDGNNDTSAAATSK
ncbi:hypothetical protein OsJ_09914 [Oryza sativa Japonica Group]|uniref:Transposase MuDR plant domain-containing protein n=1 Tax=Oryza sativa subsp. japonica TaxID=39947 RepID=B9F671_ORYSJ|nr:hypothetical protein OsJ_09914 [Oryza sativa Japonica Group]